MATFTLQCGTLQKIVSGAPLQAAVWSDVKVGDTVYGRNGETFQQKGQGEEGLMLIRGVPRPRRSKPERYQSASATYPNP